MYTIALASTDITSAGDSNDYTLPIERICEHCKLPSPQVYNAGWMCLKPKCFAFWSFKGMCELPACLNYAASFLQPVRVETDQILEDLQPGPPVSGISQDGVTTSRHFCKGFHCVKCGRLSSRWVATPLSVHATTHVNRRYKWEHWECRACSVGCKFIGPRRFLCLTIFSIPTWFPGASERQASFVTRKAIKWTGIPTIEVGTSIFWVCAILNQHLGIVQFPLALFKSGQSFGSRVTFMLPHGR